MDQASLDVSATTETFLTLLHERPYGVLATHALAMPGYPFASVLPFVPDARHNPVFFISRLAEHTQNLRQDPRASLLLFDADSPNLMTSPRATWLGTVNPVPTTPALRRRYLRYQPDAAQYIDFADFEFYRLQPERIRFVAGFGRMGWIESQELDALETLAPEVEEDLLSGLAESAPGRISILGLDPYGIDYHRDGRRLRHSFPNAPLGPDAMKRHLAGWVAGQG